MRAPTLIVSLSLLFFITLAASAAMAAEVRYGSLPEAVAAGKKLFADPSLGAGGQSCDSCHTKLGLGENGFAGKALFPKVFTGSRVATLDQAIQYCIVGALKGKPLGWDDPRLTALAAYVQSVYLGTKKEGGARAPGPAPSEIPMMY